MAYTVIKDFFERGSLAEYKAGDKYACLDPARADKLLSLGYIAGEAEKPAEEVVADPEKKTAKPKTTAKRSTKSKSQKA